MMSLVYDIGGRSRAAARFIGLVRREIQKAVAHEKSARKLTQQKIAEKLGVNRSVVNREILGGGNLTLRRVAELAWALGWEIVFELRRPGAVGQNQADTDILAAPIPALTKARTQTESPDIAEFKQAA